MSKSRDELELSTIYESMLQEDMASADVVGGSGFENGIENQDFYATGDARNPFGWQMLSRNGKVKKKSKKKSSDEDEEEEDLPKSKKKRKNQTSV